ncbi:hypothetical protein BV898_17470 [Hypsibius exemplaris]|uniref:Uncharacterized protein n=1 Tax=Hypsibius exemplaris TaxID=2072580 RepID=A0A9X6NNN0_HYPEX|nr:hypothetical protein BV898_17470 [Hypsibius exemplaris]
MSDHQMGYISVTFLRLFGILPAPKWHRVLRCSLRAFGVLHILGMGAALAVLIVYIAPYLTVPPSSDDSAFVRVFSVSPRFTVVIRSVTITMLLCFKGHEVLCLLHRISDICNSWSSEMKGTFHTKIARSSGLLMCLTFSLQFWTLCCSYAPYMVTPEKMAYYPKTLRAENATLEEEKTSSSIEDPSEDAFWAVLYFEILGLSLSQQGVIIAVLSAAALHLLVTSHNLEINNIEYQVTSDRYIDAEILTGKLERARMCRMVLLQLSKEITACFGRILLVAFFVDQTTVMGTLVALISRKGPIPVEVAVSFVASATSYWVYSTVLLWPLAEVHQEAEQTRVHYYCMVVASWKKFPDESIDCKLYELMQTLYLQSEECEIVISDCNFVHFTRMLLAQTLTSALSFSVFANELVQKSFNTECHRGHSHNFVQTS